MREVNSEDTVLINSNARERVKASHYDELDDYSFPGAAFASSVQKVKVATTVKASAAIPVAAPKPTAAEMVARSRADAKAKVATVTASSAYKGLEAAHGKFCRSFGQFLLTDFNTGNNFYGTCGPRNLSPLK